MKFLRRFKSIRQLAVVALVSAAGIANAHPIHASYAEAEYQPATAKLELAVRLFTDDAETALTRRAGKPVSFAKTPTAEIDRALLAYLRETLLVKSPDGTAQTLTWVGRELKDADQHLWIYLECPLPGGVAGARIAHRVLREVFSDQINSVRVRETAPAAGAEAKPRQVTLLFLKDAEQVVAFR